MHMCVCDQNNLLTMSTMSQTNQTVSVGGWSQDCGSMGHFLECGSFTAVFVQLCGSQPTNHVPSIHWKERE